MARGISETDVWNACDALLLEGARPTIERVRQKIGSGSPNTVSQFLDTWFKHLGGRIKDPGAFSAPSDVPDPVQQAAKHFWEAALAETRRDFDQRLSDGMAAAIANVEAEKERAAQSDAAAFEAVAKLAHLQAQLAEHVSTMETERLALATALANLANAGSTIESLESRLTRSEEALATERGQHRDAIAAAVERADGATRRAALEIEQERQARVGADKRAAASQSKLESVQVELTGERARGATAIEQLRGELRVAKRELELAQEGVAVERGRNRELGAQLSEALSRADRSEAESTFAKTLVARLQVKAPKEQIAPRTRARKSG